MALEPNDSSLRESLAHLDRICDKRFRLGDRAVETARQICARAHSTPLEASDRLIIASRVRSAMRHAQDMTSVLNEIYESLGVNASQVTRFVQEQREPDLSQPFRSGSFRRDRYENLYIEGDELPGRDIACVYALFEHDELIYIGQSTYVRQRLRTHLKKDKSACTRWAVMIVPSSISIDEAERLLIERFRPAMNKTYNWARR